MYIIKKITILYKNLIYLKLKINIKKKFKLNNYLNIYIKKGGCEGVKFNFNITFFVRKNFLLLIKELKILIDLASKLYLNNSIINYNLFKKSKFLIKNRNIKNRCNCGVSFKIK